MEPAIDSTYDNTSSVQTNSLSRNAPISISLRDIFNRNQMTYQLFSDMLDSKKHLYTTLLRILFSSDIVERTIYKKKTVMGKEKYSPQQVLAVQHLPDEKRYCPKCNEIKDNPDWEYCKKDSVRTKWLHWRPVLNETGFDSVINYILANTNTILSTGNLSEKFDTTKYAIEIAGSVDEMMLENFQDWCNKEAPITRAMRENIELTIAINVKSILTRSTKSKMIDIVGKSTIVQESITNRLESEQRKQGLGATLERWMGGVK